MFWTRVAADAGQPAQLVKQGDVWTALTWKQVGDRVRELALGLLARGRRRGDAVALLSVTRAEWVQTDFAILSAGCVTVPIYATYTSAQVASIVNDADARTLIVEDRAQLAKALAVRPQMPRLQEIVVLDGGEGDDPSVLTWARLRESVREREAELASRLDERLASLGPGDVATIVYTSGTAGEPKGVVQTHGNHMATLAALSQMPGVQPGDVHLLFLPLAHSFARAEAFLGVHRASSPPSPPAWRRCGAISSRCARISCSPSHACSRSFTRRSWPESMRAPGSSAERSPGRCGSVPRCHGGSAPVSQSRGVSVFGIAWRITWSWAGFAGRSAAACASPCRAERHSARISPSSSMRPGC
jgi:hypothetical protein